MAFQTDVHADIDRQSRFKRYLFSWNSEGLSGCVIIQEVSNWLLEIWSAHYSEHWINDFFTSLTVYRISFTSVMNQFIHPLESRVPHCIYSMERSWNLHQTKKCWFILHDKVCWLMSSLLSGDPYRWETNFALVSHFQKLKNGGINELFLSRGVGGECFKLVPPVNSKVWHGPYFSL